MIQSQRLVDSFIELIQIDSETGEEREICDFLLQKLGSLGYHAREDDSAKKTGHSAGNIIAVMEGTLKDAPTIYFTCHMDTVAPGKGIRPLIQDHYILSDGTTILGSDDKAGLAALFEALQTIQENNISHGSIEIVITSGEESGLIGARNLEPNAIHADYGFALDSNGPVGEIITAAPSQMKIKATILGRAAHAGVNPEDGISAIQVASRAISQMPLGRIDKETTANIGRFQGGTASNVIPEKVEIIAEARSLNKQKLDGQVKKMVQAFRRAAKEMDAQVEIETEVIYPSFQFAETETVVQKAIAAVRKIGRIPKISASGGGSDANVFAGFGIPTVNLGVGYEHIHTTKERISLVELTKTAELVVALIEEVAQ